MTTDARSRTGDAPNRHPAVGMDSAAATDPAVTGRKAATLAQLARRGYPVPPALVYPVGVAGDRGASDLAGIGEATEVAAEVRRHCGVGPYAVRSSSPIEDGEVSSAAGRFRTVLNAQPGELTDAIQSVLVSAGANPMAVLIQPMIHALVAGVAFGANPVTGDRDIVVVDAVPGLADALVSGAADAEQWAVAGDRATRVRTLAPGTDVLTEEQAIEIARLVTDVGVVQGCPQDVEWAFDATGLHLLQSRPITALPSPPDLDLPPGTWLFDRHHYPEGMTALGVSIAAPAVARGLNEAFARCGSLIDSVATHAVAGRPYIRMTPLGGRSGNPPPALFFGLLARAIPALRRRSKRARALLASTELADDVREWETHGKPQARSATESLAAVDVSALTDDALADHLQDARQLLDRGLQAHFRLMPAHLIAVYRLLHIGRAVLHWPDATTMQMLTGLSPASSEPTRELAGIAREIVDDPAASALVDEVAAHTDRRARIDGAALASLLATVAPGIADRLEHWISTFGLRTVNDDPGSPQLSEIGGLVPDLVVDHVNAVRGEVSAPARESADGGAADALLERARRMVRGCGQRDAQGFEQALAAARAAYPVREDNVAWALAMPAGLVRRAAMEVGRRLQRSGVIAGADDVVMLDFDTVIAAARGEKSGDSLRRAVAQARAERAWAATHQLPPFIGPAPTPPPDLRYVPRALRTVNEALALNAPAARRAAHASTDALLSGIACSPGSHTGRVQIVAGPGDFALLRHGDVMVCATTDPSWSVLFAVAGAVVADGGTLLAHAAIIAREHGIPAVLGTERATSALHTGQLVTVDGTAGTVTAAETTGTG